MRPRRRILLLLVCLPLLARGAEILQPWDFTVDGAARRALVSAPPQAKTEPSPVVFVFHGHGGTAEFAARKFHLEREWPEAIVVYMQGLPTPSALVDPAGRFPGWQGVPGGQGDRDLHFFDAVLARLKSKYRVDPKRVYATGHSNGGLFTYLLWLARGDALAAVAPASAAAIYAGRLPPKPALILGGRNDGLVKFSWQQATMDAVRRGNHCAAEGAPWQGVGTLYPSTTGTPLATYVSDGGHQFGPPEPELIAKFFREH